MALVVRSGPTDDELYKRGEPPVFASTQLTCVGSIEIIECFRLMGLGPQNILRDPRTPVGTNGAYRGMTDS